MTFTDVFKSSFLEKAADLSILDVGLAMLLAFAIGLFIFFIYKKTFAGVMYSASFGVSIMAMTMITTLIILAVTSNIVLSLGMVGALSIVRFDLMRLFLVFPFISSMQSFSALSFSRSSTMIYGVSLLFLLTKTRSIMPIRTDPMIPRGSSPAPMTIPADIDQKINAMSSGSLTAVLEFQPDPGRGLRQRPLQLPPSI